MKQKIRITVFIFVLLFSFGKIHAADYSLQLSSRQLCDLEMLLNDAFAPLDKFLDKKNYLSVIHKTRLTDGTVWPIPIVLDVHKDLAQKLKIGDCVHLKDGESK